MAETVEIVDQDRIDAENFLEQYLGDSVDGLDVGKGSAFRDLLITAMAYIVAYLRKEGDLIRSRQSLLLLAAESGDDVDDAVDEILSNWFLTRKSGRKSSGVITVYLTQAVDVTIPTTTLFYRTPSLAFVVDSDTALAYSEEDMTAVADSTGVVVEYALRVPVVALANGSEYDIEPGVFTNHTRFSAYVSRIENLSDFSGGGSVETTAEMLERAPTAISVRDLNSPRSIDVVLKEDFTAVDDVTVIGMGDNEMIRDLIEEAATGLRIHAGGYTDAYLRTPITEGRVFSGEVGGEYTDPRPHYVTLRDDTVADFVAAGVERGHVLRLYNNIGNEPTLYTISSVTAKGVSVSRRSPFPLALPTTTVSYTDGEVGSTATGGTDRIQSTLYTFTSDDVGTWVRIKDSGASNDGTWVIASINASPNYAVLEDAIGGSPTFSDETGVSFDLQSRVVEYSIGSVSTSYSNKVSQRLSGEFTDAVQTVGRVLLPAEPIYRITEVYVDDGSDPELSVGGKITFPNRVNLDALQEPDNGGALDPALLQYRVWGNNVGESFSGWQQMELQLNWDEPSGEEDRFDGETAYVTYDTLTGYDLVWAFMVGDRRLSCASIIPKGLHPAYLSMTIRYKHAKTAIDTLDETAATTALVTFINDFNVQEDLDTSDVSSFLRETYDVIGYIEPLTITYELLAPDGRVIYYETTDQVIVDTDKHDSSYSGLSYNRLDVPLDQGVSDNTIRYLTASDLITFEEIT